MVRRIFLFRFKQSYERTKRSRTCRLVSSQLTTSWPLNPNEFISGHLTQLLWASSEAVGCASANIWIPNKPGYVGEGMTSSYTVCHYSPQGNIIGHEKENYKPRRDGEFHFMYFTKMRKLFSPLPQTFQIWGQSQGLIGWPKINPEDELGRGPSQRTPAQSILIKMSENSWFLPADENKQFEPGLYERTSTLVHLCENIKVRYTNPSLIKNKIPVCWGLHLCRY